MRDTFDWLKLQIINDPRKEQNELLLSFLSHWILLVSQTLVANSLLLPTTTTMPRNSPRKQLLDTLDDYIEISLKHCVRLKLYGLPTSRADEFLSCCVRAVPIVANENIGIVELLRTTDHSSQYKNEGKCR